MVLTKTFLRVKLALIIIIYAMDIMILEIFSYLGMASIWCLYNTLAVTHDLYHTPQFRS